MCMCVCVCACSIFVCVCRHIGVCVHRSLLCCISVFPSHIAWSLHQPLLYCIINVLFLRWPSAFSMLSMCVCPGLDTKHVQQRTQYVCADRRSVWPHNDLLTLEKEETRKRRCGSSGSSANPTCMPLKTPCVCMRYCVLQLYTMGVLGSLS